MTIDEAKSMLIAKANCIDKQCKGIYEDCNESLCDNCVLCYAQGTNGDQIKLLRQCAEWLEELKKYRTLDKTNFSDGYKMAIDDLMEKASECFISDADWNYLVQEAAQLKAGGGNEK